MTETATSHSLSETEFKAFQTKVTEAFWGYEELGNELRDRVRDYLIDGADGTCLLEMPAALKNGKRKRFFKIRRGHVVRSRGKTAHQKFLGLLRLPHVTDGYFRRLGDFAGFQ
ncbi:MAG: hypothetical protein CMJ78_23720 [Planctomycetaceae bacterium]|nr:hypothetical protein [Planctomycetaceae bacterium]